jgi:predicted dehydrogenase
LDWDAWCGQVEPVPYHVDLYTPRANPGWISFRRFSGGEMTGWGAHGLDQVQWALGMDESGPVELWTEGPKYAPPTYSAPESRQRGDRICRSPQVHFRYANGAEMILQDGGPGGGAVFICEKGKIRVDRGVFQVEPKELARELVPDPAVMRGGGENHMQNWIDCIKTRERPVADVEIGHRSTTVCHLGNIARWLGRRLRWDPQNEQFIGDEQANQLLERPQRSQYRIPDVI